MSEFLLLLILLECFNLITVSSYVIKKYPNLEKNNRRAEDRFVTENIKEVFKIADFKMTKIIS